MKNMKVSAKLIVSFLMVVGLAVIVGVVGLIGMLNINNAKTDMYYTKTLPLPYLSKSEEAIQSIRIEVREMVLYAVRQDTRGVEDSWQRITATMPRVTENMDNFKSRAVDQDAIALFDSARTMYENELTPIVETIRDLSRSYAVDYSQETFDEIYRNMQFCVEIAGRVSSNMEASVDLLIAASEQSYQEADRLATFMIIAIIAVLVVAIAVSLALAFYISGLIAKPLSVMANAFSQIGTEGRLEFDDATKRSATSTATRKDELGDCAKGFQGIISHLNAIEANLEDIADGDLTTAVKVLSPNDTIGNSMQRTLDNLNTMFGEINSASNQVSTGSKQIADGAQSLAQGSTEQAASVEELSASIGEIAQKTKENAGMAERAAQLATTIMQNAQKGNEQMGDMTTAVHEINQASQSISKVIKVIDDIAFQTNILALNAAVEAARAGQHGKGFAVVAEEVRNLAAKSAEAAKDTGGLIQNSMEKAELGARIAGETAESLADIVSGINESSQIVSEIAQSSEEQSLGISQINTGIDQVAQVVQQNSATAQESAAASEQMSSQSTMLEELISQLKLKSTGFGSPSLPSRAAPPTESAHAHDDVYEPMGADDFGKY